MRLAGILFVLMVAAVMGSPQDKYSNKYDNIDIATLLKNDRVVTQYVNCLLDKGPCTPEGRDFRQHLPEALTTRCAKCTDAQANIIRTAAKEIMAKRPQDWEAIRKKYDPKGEHREAFKAFLAGK